MATLNITQFASLAKDAINAGISAGRLDGGASSDNLDYTTSTQSAVFAPTTRFIRVIADSDCYIAVGDDPTATAASTRLEADVAEYFGVQGKGIRNQRLAAYDGVS